MFRAPPDSEDERDSDESEEVVPLNRRALRRRARGVDYGATGAGIDLVGVFDSCPLLERVILGAGTGRITTRSWNELYSSLQHPNLIALRGVTLPHSRPETASFLDLLNDMPSLSEFSATSMSLQPDLALSLIEIFKMNEKLVGDLSAGRLGVRCFGADLFPFHRRATRRGCDLVAYVSSLLEATASFPSPSSLPFLARVLRSRRESFGSSSFCLA